MSLGSELLNDYAYELNNPPFRDKCYSCAYFNPKMFHCSKYLRGVETAIYLCPNCGADMRQKEGK